MRSALFFRKEVNGVQVLRERHPHWSVYCREDLQQVWKRFLRGPFEAWVLEIPLSELRQVAHPWVRFPSRLVRKRIKERAG